jgi:hypothetical protein
MLRREWQPRTTGLEIQKLYKVVGEERRGMLRIQSQRKVGLGCCEGACDLVSLVPPKFGGAKYSLLQS